MASSEERESSRFDHVLESLDLLFAKVGQLDTTQQRMATQMDLGNQVMEQMLKDQQSLSKQVEATGQAIARFSSSDLRPSVVRILRLRQVISLLIALFRVCSGVGVIILGVSDMVFLKCHFPSSLVLILVSGKTSASITFICSMFLKVFGPPWLL